MKRLGIAIALVACEKSSTLDDQPAPPELDVALAGIVGTAPPQQSIPRTYVVPESKPDEPPVGPAPQIVPPDDKGPIGRVTVRGQQAFDESTLTPDVVLAKIQAAYVAGIKRCYKNLLNKDASARGKVMLSITVNETGRAVASRAKGFHGDLDECITQLMAAWRFPAPKDKDGEPTEASFAITLQLVPD